MSAEGRGPGQRSEEHPRKGPQKAYSGVTLPQSWVRSVRPTGKEGGWAGEEAGRRMRELVSFLGRRVLGPRCGIEGDRHRASRGPSSFSPP